MIVNIEFLDVEPIENFITCLNHDVDKVVYFGYDDIIARMKDDTEYFLKKYCHVSHVEFHAMSETNLDEIIEKMSTVIDREKAALNDVFFDVTGGEGLMLLAFGALSKERKLPMHMYDVEKGWLYVLNRDVTPTLNDKAPRNPKKMDIETYVQMYGAIVNNSMHKDTKSLEDEDFAIDAKSLWNISNKYKKTWNIFCEFLREYCQPGSNLQVRMDIAEIKAKIQTKSKYQRKDMTNIFRECASIGALENLYSDGNVCTFRYKNNKIQDQLWDAGSVLELHTYMEYKNGSDDCKVGVHIDWDGTIHGGWGRDTVNEIDVLALKGYVPTFISCKNGNVDQMTLYELETVANRFGGKYGKKVLVAPQGLNKSHRIRAREMGIEVREK